MSWASGRERRRGRSIGACRGELWRRHAPRQSTERRDPVTRARRIRSAQSKSGAPRTGRRPHPHSWLNPAMLGAPMGETSVALATPPRCSAENRTVPEACRSEAHRGEGGSGQGLLCMGVTDAYPRFLMQVSAPGALFPRPFTCVPAFELLSHAPASIDLMSLRLLRGLALIPLFGLLSGCNMVVMQPSGDIAARQRDLIIASTGLMLLIIVPVIALTLLFAWRYRHSNTDAVYDPDWHHSTQLEVVIWSAPLAIIIAPGALTWISPHTLDPYRPLSRLDASRALPADVKPLTVEVVALDWKWLFFYPDQGIATVNELAAPVDVPITFKITSASLMNSFYIPGS